MKKAFGSVEASVCNGMLCIDTQYPMSENDLILRVKRERIKSIEGLSVKPTDTCVGWGYVTVIRFEDFAQDYPLDASTRHVQLYFQTSRIQEEFIAYMRELLQQLTNNPTSA